MSSSHQRPGGFGTVQAIAAIAGLGLILLLLFFLGGTPGTQQNNDSQDQQDQQAEENPADNTTSATEPPYIRIPENSIVYKNSQYNFLFAYPDSFGQLTSQPLTSSGNGLTSFRAESVRAAKKPVGIGTAFMNGSLGIYLYQKNDFRLVINSDNTFVAPTKTGNDTTWKIVAKGTSKQDISVGDAFQAKTIRSQTGVTVFDFTMKSTASILLGRYVFELPNHYALIAMPNVIKPENAVLTENDVAAYNIIGANMAKTVRIPPAKSQSNDSSNSSNTDSDSDTGTGDSDSDSGNNSNN